MFELSARLIISGLVVLLAGLLGVPDFDVAWKSALAVAAYGLLVYRLEVAGLRNHGISGFVAVADAFVISIWLASAGSLSVAGALAIAPCVYAASRRSANPAAMAPIAASGLLVSDALLGSTPSGTALYVQAGAVLLIGLLSSREPQQPPTILELLTPETPQQPFPVEGDAYLELRENYRSVRAMYRDLQIRSRREHQLCELYEAKLGEGEHFYKRLTDKIREIVEAESVALYTLAQFDDVMVVRSTSGQIPEMLQSVAHRVDLAKAPGQIKHELTKAFHALREAETPSFANVILSDAGRVLGMATIFHSHPSDLEQARREAEDLAQIVAALIREESERAGRERRLRETELLYDISVTSAGSESAAHLCSRVVRELGSLVEVEQYGVVLRSGAESVQVGQDGSPIKLMSALRFDAGEGFAGWLKSGAPEIVCYDASHGSFIDPGEALKLRVNAFAIFPVGCGESVAGYMAVATSRPGGLDVADVFGLRAVAAELGQAITRMQERKELSGLVTPAEFQRVLEATGEGWIVHLEAIGRDRLVNEFGAPAITHAMRSCGRRLRSRLPLGAALCRRTSGDFVAILPQMDEEFAHRWAAEAASVASLINLTTPDGSRKIPLALRARAARIVGSRNEARAAAQ